MSAVPFRFPQNPGLPARSNNERENQIITAIQELFGAFSTNKTPLALMSGSPLAYVNLVTGVELPGVRGRVRSAAGPVLTLGRAEDARKFKEGDTVQAAQFPGGDGLDELRSGSVQLVSVNIGQGTLTASADWASAIPGIAMGDWLCIKRGDRAQYGERSIISVEHGLKSGIVRATGYLILNARGGVPLVRRIPAPNTREGVAFEQRYVQLASVYACTADILFF